VLGHCACLKFQFRSLFFIGLARHQLYYPSRAQFPAALAAGSLRRLMAAKRRTPIRDRDLKGLKYFKILGSLLDRLHDNATARDHAGNRRLFYDQYACLLLLFFFNPVVKSLRSIQQASTLDKVQRLFGCNRVSRGSLSEASRVFDPELLHAIIGDIAAQTLPLVHGKEAEALRGLTAVDGSLLPALPKMAWALWLDPQHRAAKMHVHFDVLKGVPVETTVTAANDSETEQLRATLQARRLYVIDRGYAEYQLFQDILDARSDFIGRIRDNAVWSIVEERRLTPAAQAAGVRSDRIVWLGGPQSGSVFKQPVRVLEVDTGKTNAQGHPEILLLATSRLDLAAELVALGYRFRWTVELFFRWLKCILGCRHLLANSRDGVTIQVYLAIIASLLISLWVGRKPTVRTLEMIQFYFTGWATEDELMAHLDQLKPLTK
jgi:Transposase DDE domain